MSAVASRSSAWFHSLTSFFGWSQLRTLLFDEAAFFDSSVRRVGFSFAVGCERHPAMARQ